MVGQTSLTPLNKNDEMLICYAVDMSVSVTRSITSNKEKVMRVYVDRDEDEQGLKEYTHKIEVYKESEYIINYKFEIENNSTIAIDQLLIDHDANNDKGGYTILTKDNSIKLTD